jgi:hypothetical protein
VTRLTVPTALVTCLVTIAPVLASADVKLTQHGDTIDVNVGGKPFTTYRFDAKDDPQFARPYFFPVLAADGTPLTDDLPKDHLHHRSFYVAHGDVSGADHWSIKLLDKQPRQRHLGFDKVEGDTIVQRLAWDNKDRSAALLNETRTIRFLALDNGSRGVDLTVALTPAGKETVTLVDTKEAGLCSVRLAKPLVETGTITNAAGKTGEKDTWGKPAAWCDTSGRVNGKPYGIAILDHPSNPLHPTRWHVRAYGLMSANPFGLHDYDKGTPKGTGDFKLEPGKTTTFRYRVIFHTGDAKGAKLDEQLAAFAKE